ncbi:hypothetical protein E4U51_000109 [Claviceps purpurea]|nr:hypothetical protein E4U51_000109 [Claviceps purpurea]
MRPSRCRTLMAYALLFCQPVFSEQHSRRESHYVQPQALDQARMSPPPSSTTGISTSLFAELERLARLVDISYCVGNTGVRKPFECLSRCNEFPGLALETTWSTGFLMGDSCGYIALDHGHTPSKSARFRGDGQPKTKEGSILVAFRGTYSITNTIVDLSTVPQKYVPYPAPGDDDDDDDDNDEQQEEAHAQGPKCDNCTVHMGFLQSWQLARDTILPKLKALKMEYPSYQVQLVGHSLGGAVACLAALELKLSLGWDDLLVTTFGEPRLGNYHLARYIDTAFSLDDTAHPERRSYRRVTHNNDPVPLLPLEEWGYRSHAGEVYIAKQDLQPSEADVRTCVGDADPECSAGAATSLLGGVRRLLHFARSSGSVEEYVAARRLPIRLGLWRLFFAHRDYFWRLGLCVPGGDPANWDSGDEDVGEL